VFDDIWQDVRFGARMVRKSPLFTAVVLLTLALGIGANTAIFSLVHAALLRPLPYSDAERLVHLWDTRGSGVYAKFEASYPDFAEWREQAASFTELGGYSGAGFTALGGDAPERISASRVTSNFFSVLGAQPILGRGFLPEEERAEGPAAVILGYGYWQRRFGGDPAAIGRALNLDGTMFTIVGVLPREFHFAPRGESLVWTPLRMNQDRATRRSFHWLNVVARLKPGVTLAAADAEMKGLAARFAQEYPDSNAGISVHVAPLREEISGQIQPVLVVLMSAVGLVLLIGCANVANLMLARSAAREKEFAIRTALGAGRARLVRQLLIEGLLLAALAGAVGLLWGAWGTRGLLALIPRLMLDSMPYLKGAALNRDVLLFTLFASCLTGVLFSLAPLLHAARRQLSGALKEGGRASGAAAGRERLRKTLVVSELALALVLLVSAGLVLQGLDRLLAVELGFRPENLLTLAIRLPETKYARPEQVSQSISQLRERMATTPGVTSVSVVSTLPASNDGNTLTFDVNGKVYPPGETPEASFRTVSPDYFRSMGVPLRAGREFDERDTLTATPAAIINQTLARTIFAHEDPIGRTLKFRSDNSTATIVGVVGDVRLGNLDALMRPTIYFSHLQAPARFMHFLVRTTADPTRVVSAVRAQVNALDAELPVFLVETMDQVIAESPSVFQRRFASSIVGGFAALALLLASIGLYGVVSYLVTQRTHEIGIRMALGAQAKDIFRLVVGQGMGLMALGIALGVAAALAATRLLGALLFQVKPTDAVTYTAVTALLAAIAFAACAIPARRATRIDPLAALHDE
jgi:putative ABC transport system permease protein